MCPVLGRCAGTSDVRKAHSGIPAILVDTLAYLVKSDLNDVDFESPDGAGVWPDIARDCGWEEIIGDAVSGVLAIGDGAFKISIDPHVSEYPLLEFWTGDRVDFIRRHGRITGVVFKSLYHEGGAEYELREIYEPGSIRYELWEGEKVVPLGFPPTSRCIMTPLFLWPYPCVCSKASGTRGAGAACLTARPTPLTRMTK